MPRGFVRVDIIGKDRLVRMFKSAGAQMPRKAYKDVMAHAHAVFELSQSLVPKDTWALHDSGSVQLRFRGPLATADISYGSSEVDYALVVHERLDLRHDPPTQAKYLESAQNHYTPAFPAAVVRSVRAVFINPTAVS